MGTSPSRNLDRRCGRTNRSDRGDRGRRRSNEASDELSLAHSGNYNFITYPLQPRDIPETIDTGADDALEPEKPEEPPKPEESEEQPKPDEPEQPPKPDESEQPPKPDESEEPPKPEDAEESPKPDGPENPTLPSNSEGDVLPPDTLASDEEAGPKQELKVSYIDLKRQFNEENHHTSEYDPEFGRNHLIVRRGQSFEIGLDLDRPYNADYDEIRIIFEIDNYVDKGNIPKPNNGTLITTKMTKGKSSWAWSCALKSEEKNRITLEVIAGVRAVIGRWNIIAQTSFLKSEDKPKKFNRFKHYAKVYVLFNAFNSEDEVYMEDEVERDEAVMADTGRIFVGSAKQPWGRPWNFGQFEEDVLDCAMHLLDMSGMSYKVRGNPTYVSRALSAVTNQADENGVLVGNWSGNYEGGASPTSWAGSTKIIQKYYKNKQPVQYGQCWVFSGVLTTLCRAIGLPTRSITNFSSAHDTDESITIDTFWTEDGEKDNHRTNDSVWNFHVWNEAWMKRSDLPTGYEGWQAFDSTPQETSDGVYQAGPAPCKAIKEGIVDVRYDAQFIFAEVNSDRVNWKFVEGEFIVSTVEKNRIGLKISTNLPRGNSRPFNRYLPSYENHRLDITDHYKYPEGSKEERAAVRRAYSKASAPREGIYDQNTQDVSFTLDMDDGIMLGNNFDVIVKLQNKSRLKRTVKMTVTLEAIYYTGVRKGIVKSKKFVLELEAIKAGEAVMRIMFDDYMNKVSESASFRVDIDAVVVETFQNYSTEEDFRLRRPDLVILAPLVIEHKEDIDVVVKFQSTMSISLTGCFWLVDAPGLTKPLEIDEKDCEPYDRRELKFTLKAKKRGVRTIIVTFTSKELQDVVGSHEILVK